MKHRQRLTREDFVSAFRFPSVSAGFQIVNIAMVIERGHPARFPTVKLQATKELLTLGCFWVCSKLWICYEK